MKVYMIQNTLTGKYSQGGMIPKFGKSGKIWTRKQDLVLHWRQSRGSRKYENCIVVEYDLVQNSSWEAIVFLTELVDQAREKRMERKLRTEEYYKTIRIRELEEELKKLRGETL